MSFFFNSKSTTSVANASDHTIWVCVDMDEIRIKKARLHVDKAGNAELEVEFKQGFDPKPFLKLKRGGSLPFSLQAGPLRMLSRKAKVYVTIYQQRGKTDILYGVCENHEIEDNEGIIITDENTVCLAQQGETWVDRGGRDHS